MTCILASPDRLSIRVAKLSTCLIVWRENLRPRAGSRGVPAPHSGYEGLDDHEFFGHRLPFMTSAAARRGDEAFPRSRWLRALMMWQQAGPHRWPNPRSAHRRPDGDAPWLGTFPEVFRDTARPAIAAASSDVTMKRGLY